MYNYLSALKEIKSLGIDRQGRNGMTKSIFAKQLRWNMNDGFPAVTTKKLFYDKVKGELLWFLSGSRSDKDLQEIMGEDETIWTANAEADYWKPYSEFKGDLGRIYGVQWRSWKSPGRAWKINTTDQIHDLVYKLRNNPFDRRLIVSAWNAGEIANQMMALPPCHILFQCYVDDEKRLSLHMIQRSCDMFLGVPFNIASYGTLLHLLASVTGLVADELIITFNDAHIYHEHFDAVEEQLTRDPNPLPELWINPNITEIDDFKMEDIQLNNYQHHPPIKAEMIV